MKREVKIGLFALVILLCLWAGIRFLSGTDIFSRNHTYYATYEQINGLQPASPILIKGYKVGTVSGIEFDPAKSERVVLRLNIARRYRIPVNSQAKIFSNGLMGGKAIEIMLGDAHTYLQKGDTLVSTVDKGLMDIAGSELEFFKQKVTVVTSDLSQTLRSLNALIDSNALSFGRTMDHLSSITGSLDGVLTSQARNIGGIIESLHDLSAALGENTGRIDTILANTDRFTAQLARARIDSVAGSLQSLMASLETTLSELNSGQGTAGQLLHNRALYDSLTTATGNLSALLADLKANPRRYVHFSLFGGGEGREKRQERRAEKQRLKAEAREQTQPAQANEAFPW